MKKQIEGFRIKPWDGSLWIIPYEACVEAFNENIAKQSGIEWSKEEAIESMKGWSHPGDAEELFQGTNWSDFEKYAVRIKDPTISNMEAMWETADITIEK